MPFAILRSGSGKLVSYNNKLLHGEVPGGATLTLDDFAWLLRLEAENASRHAVTANGDAKLDGSGGCDFDGSGDYLSLNIDAFGSGDMTIEFYVTADGNGAIFDCRTPGTNGEGFAMEIASGYIGVLDWFSNILYNAVPANAISIGVRTHVAMVRDGGTMRLYVDGTQTETVANSTNWTQTSAAIGIAKDFSSVPFDGKIERLHISSNCRYPSGTPFTPPTGDIVPDAYSLLALNFDGRKSFGQFVRTQSDYMLVNDNASLDTSGSSFTVAGWCKIDSKSGTSYIASKQFYGNDSEWSLRHRNDSDRFDFAVKVNGTTYNIVASTLGSPSIGEWYYVVGYYDTDNDEIGISVNGGVFDTAVTASGSTANSTAPVQIGCINGNPTFAVREGYWDGGLASVGFWKGRVLTQSDASGIYNLGYGHYNSLSAAQKTNLVSWWDLGTSALGADSHGSNDMTNNGAALDASTRIIDSAKPSYAIDVNESFTTGSLVGRKYTLNGNASLDTANGYVSFDGNGDYVFFNTSFDMNPLTESFAIELDVYFNSVGGKTFEYLCDHVVDSNNRLYIYWSDGNLLDFVVRSSGSIVTRASVVWTPSSSTRYVLRWEVTPSSDVVVKIDGTPQTTTNKVGAAASHPDFSSAQVRLGMNGLTPADGLNGRIYDFKYEQGGQSVQMEADADAVVGFCPDVSGNENDGTPTNVTYDPFTPAYVLNGSSSYVSLVDVISQDVYTFGVAQSSNPASVASMYYSGDKDSDSEYHYVGYNNDLMRYEARTLAAGIDSIQDSSAITILHVMSALMNEADRKLWKNGSLVGTSTASRVRNLWDRTEIGRNGRLTAGNYFNGKIGSVLVSSVNDVNDTDRQEIEALLTTQYSI